MNAADVVDAALEWPIAPSFTRLGYDVRSRTDGWRRLDEYDETGQVAVITGATSGIGLAAARQMAANGATVVLVGRDAAKTDRVRDELADATGSDRLETVVADLSELDAVEAAATAIAAAHDRVDVLVHNAGALDVDHLEMDAAHYRGTEQYARAKRAQVTLNELWAERLTDRNIVCHAVHPGWADTPGVERSLPRFRTIVGPLLRSPEQGADTLVWLAADPDEPLATTGLFWLDRRPRPIHRLPATRRSDTPEERARLWNWCIERSGVAAELLG